MNPIYLLGLWTALEYYWTPTFHKCKIVVFHKSGKYTMRNHTYGFHFMRIVISPWQYNFYYQSMHDSEILSYLWFLFIFFSFSFRLPAKYFNYRGNFWYISFLRSWIEWHVPIIYCLKIIYWFSNSTLTRRNKSIWISPPTEKLTSRWPASINPNTIIHVQLCFNSTC